MKIITFPFILLKNAIVDGPVLPQLVAGDPDEGWRVAGKRVGVFSVLTPHFDESGT